MKRLGLLLLVAVALVPFPVEAQTQRGVNHVNVDARDAPRRLIHVQLNLPANPGPMTLLYPEWIPGEHGPTGPIADLVSLRVRAKDHTLPWKRDSTNLFAFHVTVPAGSTELDVSFDFISPADNVGGFSSGASMTTELAVLSWNQYVLYPEGEPAEQLLYQASLRLPSGWHYGTALPVAKESRDEIDFRPVPLTTLIDSPVSAGAHYRAVEFGTVDGAAHYMHIAADSDRAIAMTPEIVKQYQKLIAEAGALFGVRHYRSYHFLLTLSDHVASFGLEHHESSDDRLDERSLSDDALRQYHAELLPHEYVHSWNGKYRRPAGLVTKDYSEPMKGDLLWVYEGLTEYLGAVLSARSGMETPELFRDRLAYLAAHLDHESGRAWRPLSDTAISGQILYGAREDYAALRRGTDFYGEAELVWLEVDTLIRQLSHGSKSIDDFCRAFYSGPSGGGKNDAEVVKPYRLEELVATLTAVQPYDWAGFFRQRVDSVEARAPMAGLENAGWKLFYNNERSDYWNMEEEQHKDADLTMSLGMLVKNEGVVEDVEIGGPAQKSGIAPGARITSVNGRQFTTAVLREAVQAAAVHPDDPIEIVVKNGEYFSTHQVDYRGGEKYPHLERERGKPDVLTAIVQPRTK
jgi:predicted metalloprotease with PDZ domain